MALKYPDSPVFRKLELSLYIRYITSIKVDTSSLYTKNGNRSYTSNVCHLRENRQLVSTACAAFQDIKKVLVF